ncbi:MAG: ComF family protein [Pseudomonadota bacterium]
MTVRVGMTEETTTAGPTGPLSTAASGLRDLLFPPECPACRAETATADGLCARCFADTQFLAGPACVQCARPEPRLAAPDPDYRCDRCLAAPPAWDRAAAVALYGGAMRRLVLGLKHGDRLDTVPLLARWMAASGAHLLRDADLLVPIPLHWTRRLKRRFNQSAELARAVAREAGRAGDSAGHSAGHTTPVSAPDILRRIRRTASQEGRSRSERRLNMIGALAVRPGAAARVAGRHVVLIDDVMTSGATLDAAASALRTAGAARVDALVIALAKGREADYFPALTDGHAAPATDPRREGDRP